jgi:hypothetical protein
VSPGKVTTDGCSGRSAWIDSLCRCNAMAILGLNAHAVQYFLNQYMRVYMRTKVQKIIAAVTVASALTMAGAAAADCISVSAGGWTVRVCW